MEKYIAQSGISGCSGNYLAAGIPGLADKWRHLPGDVSRRVDASYHACDFVDLKLLFQREDLPEGLKRSCRWSAAVLFRCTFSTGLSGRAAAWDVIYQKLMPYIGYLPAFLIEIFVLFGIRVALTWVMKKLPVFRRLL